MKAKGPEARFQRRLSLLEKNDPLLCRVGEMSQWLCSERQIPPEASVPVIRAWLGAIRRDVLSDAERSQSRLRSFGAAAETDQTLLEKIRRGDAVLRLTSRLSPNGWDDPKLEEELSPGRKHADVMTEISIRTDYDREQLDFVLKAIAQKLTQLRNRYFEPLGCVVAGDHEGFRIALWDDYLQPRIPGRFTRYTHEEVLEDRDPEDVLEAQTNSDGVDRRTE